MYSVVFYTLGSDPLVLRYLPYLSSGLDSTFYAQLIVSNYLDLRKLCDSCIGSTGGTVLPILLVKRRMLTG